MSDDEASRIYQGATFDSFEEFEKEFEEWMTKGGHLFRVASSEVMKGSTEMVETFRYRFVSYNCVHFGEPRIKGTSQRPRQSYLPCGCKAMLRLTYMSNEDLLRLVKFVDKHTGHEVENNASCRNYSSPVEENQGEVPREQTVQEEYQWQVKVVEKLKKEQKAKRDMVNKARRAKGLPDFDPPPLRAESLGFYIEFFKKNEPMTHGEEMQMNAVTERMFSNIMSRSSQQSKNNYEPYPKKNIKDY